MGAGDGYFTDFRYLTNSRLRCFRQSRLDYRDFYVTQTRTNDVTSKVMDIGTMAHAGILEPDRFDSLYRLIPAEALSKPKSGAKSGAKSGQAWKDWSAEHSDTINLKQQEYDLVRGMVDAIVHPTTDGAKQARAQLDRPGVAETVVTAERTVFGVPLRCKPDYLTDGLNINLKTTGGGVDPGSFARVARSQQYFHGAAFYDYTLLADRGTSHRTLFVFVSQNPPHRVRCYSIHDDDYPLVQDHVFGSIDALVRCQQSGQWSEPNEETVLQVSLGKWSYLNQWESDDG